MLLQTLYFVVDLYFVAHLGDAAIAGVSAAGNLMFVVFALTQTLGVGTVALISHAVGRKDRADANHVFNQSVAMSALCAALTLVGGLRPDAAPTCARSPPTPRPSPPGMTYLYWFLPGLALQFALVVMGSALRGTGIVKPTMVVQVVTVLLNIVLAPVLIAGWGTGHPLGVAGAGLASTVAIALGVVLLVVLLRAPREIRRLRPGAVAPALATWRRMLNIGLPAGGEFALMFVYIALIYWIIRDFGAAAQAGFGIGSRIMQSIFLPAMAVAFAAAPIAGQNFGARQAGARARDLPRGGAVELRADGGADRALPVAAPGAGALLHAGSGGHRRGGEFLQIVSWNFVAMGIVFTCSSMFQALGNTWPALLSTAVAPARSSRCRRSG